MIARRGGLGPVLVQPRQDRCAVTIQSWCGRARFGVAHVRQFDRVPGGNDEQAIGGMESLERGDRRMARAGGLWRCAGGGDRDGVLKNGQLAVEHGESHFLALVCLTAP